MTTEPTTLVTWAAALGRLLAARGCDAPRLFAAAGLDYALTRDPNQRYPLSGMTRLWHEAARATADPCIGLEIPRYVQPATMHALGLSVLASETLEDALHRTARFSRLVAEGADVEVERTAQAVQATLRPITQAVPIADEAYDAFIATFVHTGRMISLNESLAPLRVELTREPPPRGIERYADFFRCAVYFGQDANRLVLPLAAMTARLPMANPELVRQNDQVVRQYLAHFDRQRPSHQVRDQIIRRLPSGEPTQDAIAAALNLSLRSLQRRLAEEGTSFTDILADTRRELASQYLRQSRLALSEITYLLGFADQSNFTRAFKRWTGLAPGEFRERERRAP